MTNYRVVELELKRKLQAGTVSQDDIAKAAEVARAFGSLSSRVLFANVKRQVEAQEMMQQIETEAE